jgi:hypothetical protein
MTHGNAALNLLDTQKRLEKLDASKPTRSRHANRGFANGVVSAEAVQPDASRAAVRDVLDEGKKTQPPG